MIPILFKAEAEPDALIDVNSVDLQDVNSVDLLASDDKTLTRAFSSYGIGSMSDCISCEVSEERNGEYELEMEYPDTGKHYEDVELRCIILAKPNYTDNAQAFRVYYISSPIDGVVQIRARHIVYDLSGVPVMPFTATSCSAACAGLTSNAAIDTPFTIGTQIGTIADFEVDIPSSVRSWFGGKEGSLIDVYDGEWAYDNYTATLKSARGADRGVVIRYGKNLIDFEQEENCENTWTGVLPYWTNEEGTLVKSDITNVAGSYDYRRILCLDCSADFEEQPTVGQLTNKAQKYISDNDIGIPKVNITLDYVQVSELTDRVDLCDTVKVVFERIGVETSAKCIRTVWDVLKDRYSSVEFGDVNPDITDTIATLEADTEKAKVSVSATMLNAIATATALITGNSGGYVVMRDSDSDGYPDEILIMDTADIDTATKVWRWNSSGLGYSASGYNGTYGLAITQNGAIVADFITTGTLDASQVNVENLDASNITTGTLDANVVTVANIDASNITTGTMSANRIKGGTLTLGGSGNGNGIAQIYDANSSLALELNRTGMVINRAYTFYASDYTEADRTAVQQILLGNINPTAAQLNKYDLNGDGMITSIDALRIAKFLNGTESSYTINANLQVGSTSSATIIETPGVHIRPGGMFADSGGFGTLYADIIIPKNQTTTPQITVNGTLEVGTLKTTLIQSGGTLTVTGATTLNSALTVNSSVSVKGNGVEIFHATPFIDFHFGNSTADYTARIIEKSSGALTAYSSITSGSDARWKDIQDEDIPDVSELKAVRYKWNEDSPVHEYERIHTGYIAQEVQKVAPEYVYADDEGYLDLNYTELLVAKVTCLEKRCADLESRLAELEKKIGG